MTQPRQAVDAYADQQRANDVWDSLSADQRRDILRRIEREARVLDTVADTNIVFIGCNWPDYDPDWSARTHFGAYVPDPDAAAPRPVDPVADVPHLTFVHRRPSRWETTIKLTLFLTACALAVWALIR